MQTPAQRFESLLASVRRSTPITIAGELSMAVISFYRPCLFLRARDAVSPCMSLSLSLTPFPFSRRLPDISACLQVPGSLLDKIDRDSMLVAWGEKRRGSGRGSEGRRDVVHLAATEALAGEVTEGGNQKAKSKGIKRLR